jgi:hypothetical protein
MLSWNDTTAITTATCRECGSNHVSMGVLCVNCYIKEQANEREKCINSKRIVLSTRNMPAYSPIIDASTMLPQDYLYEEKKPYAKPAPPYKTLKRYRYGR